MKLILILLILNALSVIALAFALIRVNAKVKRMTEERLLEKLKVNTYESYYKSRCANNDRGYC